MISNQKNKVFVGAMMALLLVVSVAAISPNTPPKNLKVLPKNISNDSLEHLMRFYNVSLKVKCGYCHVKGNKASDDNPLKDVTRKMILMTDEMNAKYLQTIVHQPSDTTALQIVTCNTCHRGEAKPVVPAVTISKEEHKEHKEGKEEHKD